jgi:hypothetical protein
MADTAPLPSETLLISGYKTDRTKDGDLVLMMPWPGRPVLGCAVPVALVSIGALIMARLANAGGLYGLAVMAPVFAAIVIPSVIYQSSHAWVLSRGFIQRATTLGHRHWSEPGWLGAQSVAVQRELWPGGGGSTDRLLVVTDSGSPLRVLSVYNWAGDESRLATGGMGSLARTGPTVPSAPEPLAPLSDANLKSSISEAVREIAELAVCELGVPLAYVSVYARQRPDEVD